MKDCIDAFNDKEKAKNENLTDILNALCELIDHANQDNRLNLDSEFIEKLLELLKNNEETKGDINSIIIIYTFSKFAQKAKAKCDYKIELLPEILQNIFDLLKIKAEKGEDSSSKDIISNLSEFIKKNAINISHEFLIKNIFELLKIKVRISKKKQKCFELLDAINLYFGYFNKQTSDELIEGALDLLTEWIADKEKLAQNYERIILNIDGWIQSVQINISNEILMNIN